MHACISCRLVLLCSRHLVLSTLISTSYCNFYYRIVQLQEQQAFLQEFTRAKRPQACTMLIKHYYFYKLLRQDGPVRPNGLLTDADLKLDQHLHREAEIAATWMGLRCKFDSVIVKCLNCLAKMPTHLAR